MGHLFKTMLLHEKVACKSLFPAVTSFAIPSAQLAVSVVQLSDSSSQKIISPKRIISPLLWFPDLVHHNSSAWADTVYKGEDGDQFGKSKP